MLNDAIAIVMFQTFQVCDIVICNIRLRMVNKAQSYLNGFAVFTGASAGLALVKFLIVSIASLLLGTVVSLLVCERLYVNPCLLLLYIALLCDETRSISYALT